MITSIVSSNGFQLTIESLDLTRQICVRIETADGQGMVQWNVFGTSQKEYFWHPATQRRFTAYCRNLGFSTLDLVDTMIRIRSECSRFGWEFEE